MATKSSKTSTINVGVIGVGIGAFHVRAYQLLQDVKVAAICDIDEQRGQAAAKQFNVEKFYNHSSLLFADPKIDAVSICVPNDFHASISVAAVKAGKHVLCEKPIANTLANAHEIADVAREATAAGKVFMMGMCNRFRGDTQVLRKFIENGSLGEIYHAKCGYIRRAGIPGFGGWFTTKQRSGGGPMIDIGVHVLDQTMYLMGNPVPVSVSGVAHAKFGPRGLGTSSWGAPVTDEIKTFDVEDFALGFVKFSNGATLTIEASWASHIKNDLYYSNILGTEGGADLDTLTIYRTENGTPVDITPKVPVVNVHDTEIAHFIECIRTGLSPISPAQHALHVFQIIDAIYRSSESGRDELIGNPG